MTPSAALDSGGKGRAGAWRLLIPEGSPLRLALMIILIQAAVGILILAVFQTYLPETLGAGLAYPGYAITSFSIVKLALHTPAGFAADRIGRRPTLLAGIAATIPVLGLMLAVRDAALFLGLAGLYGVGIAALWPAVYAMIADATAPDRRGGALAVINAAYLVGLGLGALLGAFITDYASAEAAILACIGLNAAALGIAVGLRPSTGVRPLSRRSLAREGLPALRDLRLAALAAIVLLTATGTSSIGPVLRAYAIEELDVSFSTFILAMLGPVGLAALAFVPAGRLADTLGRLRPLTAGLALCGCSLLGMGLAGSTLGASVGAAGALVSYAAIQPSWTAAMMDRAPERLRGTVMGAVAGLAGLAGAIGPAVGGTIGQELGPAATFRFAAVIVLAAFMLSAALLAAERRRGAEPARLAAAGGE